MTAQESAPEPKVKHPRAAAIAVARELCGVLAPLCQRIIVAGSLRRKKEAVGDVEILYIPRHEMRPDPTSLFADPVPCNAVDLALDLMLSGGRLARRLNKDGRTAWGEKNKLAVHVASGIPVDLFATEEESWWNYLVCRTGGAQSNVAIAAAAKERGWQWNPCGAGFTRGGALTGRPFEERAMRSEEEVFRFVGLDFLPPEERQ